tara:strand:+ start:5443 stop:6447 length:1005 start_codon:yes stop_codon:yes gene_type:complete
MNQPVSNTTALEKQIEGRMDKEQMSLTNISKTAGGVTFENMGQVMEFAKLMSVSRQAVPKHLRGEPGACMAVSMQALGWRMDPFAVANKSYMVNDRIAYEAQLIHAVIEQRAPIKGRIKGEVSGEGPTRKWTLTAKTTDGDEVVYVGNEFGKITTKNSPLWKSDPDQQLWFYSVRAMCRRHFPDVLLGVYEKEEIKHAEGMRDVTPQQDQGGWAAQAREARGEIVHDEDGVVSEAKAIQERRNDKADQSKYVRDNMPDIEDADIDQTDPADEGTAGHWTDDVDADEGAPGTAEWNDGEDAFKQGAPITDCPHEDNMEAAQDWLGGYDGARRAAK